MNRLTTIAIDDVYRHLLRAGGPDGRALAPGTVHRVHVALHRTLTQAVRWEWVWLNPANAASPPRVAPTEVRPPSPDQVNRLVTFVEARDLDFATYLWLAASTGARRSQLLGLRWTEIDARHAAIGFTPRLRRRSHRTGPTRHQDTPHLSGGDRRSDDPSSRRAPPACRGTGRNKRCHARRTV